LQKWKAQTHREVVPRRVRFLNQIVFVLARPTFDLLLAFDDCFHRVGDVVPDKPANAVPLGEAIECALSMLDDSPDEIRCHARVQSAVVRFRKQIDARRSFHRRAYDLLPGRPRHKAGVTV
jgi:hypothetical protein